MHQQYWLNMNAFVAVTLLFPQQIDHFTSNSLSITINSTKISHEPTHLEYDSLHYLKKKKIKNKNRPCKRWNLTLMREIWLLEQTFNKFEMSTLHPDASDDFCRTIFFFTFVWAVIFDEIYARNIIFDWYFRLVDKRTVLRYYQHQCCVDCSASIEWPLIVCVLFRFVDV